MVLWLAPSFLFPVSFLIRNTHIQTAAVRRSLQGWTGATKESHYLGSADVSIFHFSVMHFEGGFIFLLIWKVIKVIFDVLFLFLSTAHGKWLQEPTEIPTWTRRAAGPGELRCWRTLCPFQSHPWQCKADLPQLLKPPESWLCELCPDKEKFPSLGSISSVNLNKDKCIPLCLTPLYCEWKGSTVKFGFSILLFWHVLLLVCEHDCFSLQKCLKLIMITWIASLDKTAQI